MEISASGTEGFDKAEVTLGGIDTNELSSKTMESKKVKGLYLIGEVVDVTGWLGGYNFQWAWASVLPRGKLFNFETDSASKGAIMLPLYFYSGIAGLNKCKLLSSNFLPVLFL
ncbi:MAG: NAD(P)/FAD-dependent oxidoreductase [Ignavibacteria bacterium]|nr:NAD(P)/FAD-dependent oxidoreductase [Ignavibacteria bacterium]